MTPEGLALTNVWLGILAIISLLEFLAIAAAGIFAFRMYRRAMTAVESIERNQIAPLRARVDAVLDEVQAMTARVKHAEESVSHALKQVAGTGSQLVDVARNKARPILGFIRGIRAVANAMLDGDSSAPSSSASPERAFSPAGPFDVSAR